MNKKLNFISILCFFFILFSSPLVAQSLLSTPQAMPGEVLTAVVHKGGADDSIGFMLIDSDGKVRSKAEGLPFDLDELEGHQYIGLLGLGSELKPGNYKLRSEIRNGKGLTVYERPVLIRSREFYSEDIPLNSSMSDLRSEDSEEKQNQSRRLWALLSRVSSDEAHSVGTFTLPVDDFIESSWYGDRRRYLYADGSDARSVHNGLDMAAKTGTEIHCPADGKVVMAEQRILTGWTVVLEHLPGVYTLYYHLDRMDVVPGDEMKTGDLMGTIGSTGLVTGSHLHWEMRVNTIPVDPKRYLSYPLIDKARILSIINGTKEQGR